MINMIKFQNVNCLPKQTRKKDIPNTRKRLIYPLSKIFTRDNFPDHKLSALADNLKKEYSVKNANIP